MYKLIGRRKDLCEVSRSSSRLSRSMAGSPVEGNLHKRYGRKLRSTFGSHGSLNRRVGGEGRPSLSDVDKRSTVSFGKRKKYAPFLYNNKYL